MGALSLTPLGLYDLVSGLVLLTLGFVILRAGFSNRVNQVFFLYLFFRGGFATLTGLMKSATSDLAGTFFAFTSVHFEIGILAGTLALAFIYPRPAPVSRSGWFWGALLGVTLLLDGLYVLDHGLFIREVIPASAFGAYARNNAPATHFYYAALLAAQAALIWRFAQAYMTPASAISRDQAKYVFAGTLAVTSYNFGFWAGALPVFLDRGYFWGNSGTVLQGLFALGGGALAIWLLRAIRAAGKTEPHGARDFTILAGVFGVTIASGLLDAAIWATGSTSQYYWNAGPLWRIVGAGFFAYAILRFQLFDMDIRLKRLVGQSLQAGGGIAVFAATSFALLTVLGASPGGIVVAQATAAGATLLCMVPLGNAGRVLAEKAFPGDIESADAVLERKLTVYRAALEAALEGATTYSTSDQELLRRLRDELGLTGREHAIMEFAVRQAQRRSQARTEATEVGPGAVLLGKYRIERVLGQGTSGVTYLASAGANSPPVALKHLQRPAGSSGQVKLLREAKALATVRHPNVTMLLDVEASDNDVFIIMEYADGGSLQARINEGGPLPIPEACAVLREVLLGLRAVHEHGLVHRDIKPANVLLTSSGQAKLADFGISTGQVRPDATLVGFESVGAGAGTPAYMSPEQARGSAVDTRSDLYATAALFYEMLTGRTYLHFAGLSEFEIRGLILSEPPILPLEGQPAWVTEFLRRGLAKDAERRFQTADEMLEALRSGAGQMLPPA